MNVSGNNPIENHESYCQFIMEDKSLNLHDSPYHSSFKAGDALSINVASQKYQKDDQNVLLDDPTNGTSFIKHEITSGHIDSWIGETRVLQDWKIENVLDSEYHAERSKGDTTKCGSEIEEHENISRVKTMEVKVAEYDLERILEEQETHDLYCPNCKSCITRRVILRKRKRTIRESQSDTPTKKVYEEQAESAVLGSSSAPDQTTREDEQEPDVFRCLSCFSFFIPTGDGFSIFRIFGKRGETPTERLEPSPQRKVNWISSIFKSELTKKKASGSGSTVLAETIGVSGTNTVEVPQRQGQEPPVVRKVIESSSTIVEQVTMINRERILDDQVMLEEGKPTTSRDFGTVIESSSIMVEQAPMTNKERNLGDQAMLEGKPTTSRDFGTVIESSSIVVEQVPMTNKERILEGEAMLERKPTTSRDFGTVIESSSVMVEQVPMTNKERILGDPAMLEGKPTTSSDFGTVIASSSVMVVQVPMTNRESILDNRVMLGGKPTNSGDRNTVFESSDQSQLNIQAEYKPNIPIELPSGSKIPLPGHANDGGTGKRVMDTGVIINEVVQRIPSSAGDASTPLLSTQVRIDIDEQDEQVSQQGYEWDVLKAIVYGGLMESITSLGVVSSAAGADASTLTIIALGLANLIGGLMIIIHDLFDLKTEHDEVTDRKDERVGRYWQLIGRRKHFGLHVCVAVISYILMGLLPPAIYGFTWLKSDNKEYKLIAVAASSLVCISLLAIGKAHVRSRKGYFQCLFYYLSLGVSASGISYVAGVLFNKLLEKLGLYDLNSHSLVPSNLMYHAFNGKVPAWAS